MKNKPSTAWTRSDWEYVVTAFIGFSVGMLMVGLSSDPEAGIFLGIVVITFSCTYAGAYVGRWELANTIESDIMNLEEQYRRDPRTLDDRALASAIVESLGSERSRWSRGSTSRLDRAKSEFDRRFLLRLMVIAPAVVGFVLWILLMVFD